MFPRQSICLTLSLVGLSFFLQAQTGTGSTSSSHGTPANPCDQAQWGKESVVFNSGSIALHFPPASLIYPSDHTFSFDATLEWEEKVDKNAPPPKFVCALRNPQIKFNVSHVLNATYNNAPCYIHVEADGYIGARTNNPQNKQEIYGDFFQIDNDMVLGVTYAQAARSWRPNYLAGSAGNFILTSKGELTPGGPAQATSVPCGTHSVAFVWHPDRIQPREVNISGPEGRRIELNHTSPAVIVRRVVDQVGRVIPVGLGVNNPFKIEQLIQAN